MNNETNGQAALLTQLPGTSAVGVFALGQARSTSGEWAVFAQGYPLVCAAHGGVPCIAERAGDGRCEAHATKHTCLGPSVRVWRSSQFMSNSDRVKRRR